MELSKKVAYLKGLMEGLKIDDSTDEGKVLKAMADVLEEIADTVLDIAVEVDETVDVVDAISDDLSALEDVVYETDDDYDSDLDDDDFDAEQLYECICPTCGDTIRLGEELIAQGVIECPNCGEKLEFDFSELEDEDTED